MVQALAADDLERVRALGKDPERRPALYPQLIAWANQQQHVSQDPEALRRAIRGRELALEWDPLAADNLVQLVGLALATQDEWRVYLYAQALAEVWEGLPSDRPSSQFGIQANPFFKGLLSGLGLAGYWDVFFGLGLAYVPALPVDQQNPARAVLAQLATYYAPDWLAETPLEWQPQDLLHWSVPEMLKLLFDGSSLRGYSIIAEQMGHLATAPQVAQDPELELRLLADALDYCCLSGIPSQAQQHLERILQVWPLKRLAQIPQYPQPGSLVLAWTFVFRVCFDWAYLSDDQTAIRQYQQLAGLGVSRCLQQIYLRDWPRTQHPWPQVGSRPLRVGYLGHCFRRHSVGTLSYQTLTQHDPERVQSFYYFTGTLDQPEDPIYQAFREGAWRFYDLAHQDWPQVLTQVQADDLDILVHMDATTSDVGCRVAALKPAPIQISWLGGDAPGIPEIGYFLVDPHIVAADAQADYGETLVRLPTFAAVRSFPVASLDLEAFRSQLRIPDQSVVFWTSAHARKRSDPCIEAHLEILAAVPQAVLVIKGVGDITGVIATYRSRAQRWNVADRLRFLPMTRFNEDHRAQLQLADLILDTFPYTGATHTFEALYLGIPVLTLVGRHYYGRMSYSLLQTLKLKPCITWDREHYIQQGIQLGQDPQTLRQLRQTILASQQDPACVLWDPLGLVRRLEAIYEQLVREQASQPSPI